MGAHKLIYSSLSKSIGTRKSLLNLLWTPIFLAKIASTDADNLNDCADLFNAFYQFIGMFANKRNEGVNRFIFIFH